MDMTEAQRLEIAKLVKMERGARFGTKSAAYRAAGLNATTWNRIEEGLPVRDDRLRAALQALWPESRGDWRTVFSPDPADRDPLAALLARTGDSAVLREYLDQLAQVPLADASDEELLAEIARRFARTRDQEVGGEHDQRSAPITSVHDRAEDTPGPPLDLAARDVGTPSRGQQLRERQDRDAEGTSD